ncbi:MAG: OB-fold nucleic acid binding domain-containing protein, partial [Christensenellales bacterium]
MKKTDIKQIYNNAQDFAGKQITVGGWVRSVRDLKTFAFMDLNDGTSFKGLQIVIDSQTENYAEISKLNTGSSVLVCGEIVLTPQNKQPFEMHAKNVSIICKTDETYPLQKKGSTLEFLRENAYLRPRVNLFNAVFRVRSVAAIAIHNYFQQNGYLYVNTPLITT